jgi:predicted Zn-ribbon and HTH transcriptional regulator
MGLFDRFKKDKQQGSSGQGPFAGLTEVQAELLEGNVDLDVVGESFYQEALWHTVGGVTKERVRTPVIAILVPEPDNQYDANAIAVYIGGLKVGHLGSDDAARLIGGLNVQIAKNPGKFIALNGVVAGGGMRDDGLGRLGVFLNHDPSDFGIKVVKGNGLSDPVHLSMGTGESYALMTDEADDSYDLSWMETLGTDGPKALRKLRELAETNQEPVSRHFIFSRLEGLLYGYRDDLPDALDEYDRWAEQHHQELAAGMRQVLIEKFGSLPRLETYKQSVIRQNKAKNYEAAAMWADRGIEMYGDDAFKDEWVADLEKRAAQAQARLEKASAPKTPKQAVVAGEATEAADGSMVEVLTCQTCGKDFERVRTRGRKPSQCPDCQG